ncbi:MAG: aminoacyl-tRNA hydrolase [Chromatiales bacterium]|jgi:ribosome-associated protein|nr:aminoacyl-tRNA hydrolase [Chromatiales bacterium]
MSDDRLIISGSVSIPLSEIEFSAIRAQGAGGQNVNKVSSAIHLRFDPNNSSLPEFYRQRLAVYADSRIAKDGVIVIKAQNHRTQALNRADALERLSQLIAAATHIQKTRRPTKPSRGATKRRLKSKDLRSRLKTTRRRVGDDD